MSAPPAWAWVKGPKARNGAGIHGTQGDAGATNNPGARQGAMQWRDPDGSLWLFSSSEAVANLCAALPSQDWSSARALATHPRIADAARRAGFGRVDATAASLEAVVRSLESVA